MCWGAMCQPLCASLCAPACGQGLGDGGVHAQAHIVLCSACVVPWLEEQPGKKHQISEIQPGRCERAEDTRTSVCSLSAHLQMH